LVLGASCFASAQENGGGRGETPSKRSIIWGYAICDRCIRAHHNVLELQQKPTPQWPYPEVPLG
jgi:hypothetical protein